MKILVKHESKKFDVVLDAVEGEPLTLSDLAKAVEKECEVPVNKQKLIYNGRTLNEYHSTLSDLGVKNKSKIMVIGKKNSPEEDQLMKEIEQINKRTKELLKRLEDLQTDVKDASKGFLDSEKIIETYQKCSKNLKGVAEGFMKNLETLDAMTIASQYTAIREKRKDAIRDINNYLGRADKQIDELDHILDTE
ncbi:BAG family molecular chaperone regulator 1-like isoform X1 [Clytia hemisphaerica]|uniref:BAG family molecular chaperone regulator 1 n=1 Tax=Clytia hemisphaerica TaxID=252671 RepID=A0A7M5WSN4_9CNID|eukprot:TCONS_00009397-protein